MNFKLTKGNIFDNRVIEDLIKSILGKKVNYLEIKVIYVRKKK